jgi:hypothetical protein
LSIAVETEAVDRMRAVAPLKDLIHPTYVLQKELSQACLRGLATPLTYVGLFFGTGYLWCSLPGGREGRFFL